VPRLVSVQVISNETRAELAYTVSDVTGAELIGERLGPVGCLSLDRGNQETVLVELVVLVVEDDESILASSVLLAVLEVVGDGNNPFTILLLHAGDFPNEVCAVLILVESILNKQEDIGVAAGDILSLDRVIICTLGRKPLGPADLVESRVGLLGIDRHSNGVVLLRSRHFWFGWENS